MADLASTFTKVNDVEVAPDAPVTESLFTKLGQNDNYLKDNLDAEITNRTNADNLIQADVDLIKTYVNTLIRVPLRVATGTSSTSPHDPGASQRVHSVWFEKRTGANESYLKVQLFNDDGDDMILDFYVNLGVAPNTWDYGIWVQERDTATIRWSLYNDVILSVP